MHLRHGPIPKAKKRMRRLAAPSAASIAFSAASALEPSGPPACAMSGRPPPPLPPSASAPLRTRSTALKRAGEVGGDADHDAGLAVVGDADDGDHAGADLLLALVGEAAQVLQVDAFDRARHQLDVADAAHAVAAAVCAPPPMASFLRASDKLALELLALVEQRAPTRAGISSSGTLSSAAAALAAADHRI